MCPGRKQEVLHTEILVVKALPGPRDAGAYAGSGSSILEQACHGQVLQGEARHIEDRDVGRLPVRASHARQQIAQFGGRHLGGPLRLADLARLRLVVDVKTHPLQQALR